MCGGGGGSRATIVMPKTDAFERRFARQRELITSQINGQTQQLQMQLQQSLQNKQDLLTTIRDAKVERATNEAKTDEQARRMSALIGAPPPEPTAKAPVVGKDREDGRDGVVKRGGKSKLRIDRPVATSSGQGSGLNIT